MDQQAIAGRLAAHAEEPVEDFAAEVEQAPEAEDKPPEPTTVGDVIRLFGGSNSEVVVGLLKTVGALVEDGDSLVYTLYRPLGKAAGADTEANTKKLRFATALTGYHKRRMARLYEAAENAVLMSWVEALTGKARGTIDRLHWIDAEACIAIAHYVEGLAGNE